MIQYKFKNQHLHLTYDDVLLEPRYSDISSRSECSLRVTLKGHTFATPIMAANMDTICGVKMAEQMRSLGGIGVIHRNLPVAEIQNGSFVAVGSIKSDKLRIDALLESGIHHIVVDIAHGHHSLMKDTLKYIKSHPKYNDDRIVIAGNVATRKAVEDLAEWGADAVKVGVGPGSVCTTRIKTGTGVPQLYAILDCATADVPIIADGGIKTPGDAVKALASGATFVMIGGMLAGTDCTPGWEDSSGEFINFRGMASMGAKADTQIPLRHEEGISTFVKKKPVGSTVEVIQDIQDGIRSAMSYSGCRTLEQFVLESKFIAVSHNTHKENHAHIKG